MRKKFQLLLLFQVVFWALSLHAQGIGEDPEGETELTYEQMFIQSDIAVSRWFDSVADGMDLFLAGGKRITRRRNDTHVRLENSTYSLEGDNGRNTSSLVVDLRLPNVEEYWQLKFTSYDEQQEKRGVQNGYLRQTPRENNYGASIGVFKKLGNIRTAFQPRIELTDPLKVSHSLSFESLADLKTYQINPKLELFAKADKGTGIYTALNFNLVLTKIYSLTFINNGEYAEKTHLFTVINGISLGQVVNRKSSFAYSFIVTSVNQPNYQMQSYGPSVSWSQLIYRKILDYQIIPHWDFARENSYKGVLGLVININLNF